MARSRYSIIVYRCDKEGEDVGLIKSIPENTLYGARAAFSFQLNNLRWSLAHRINMGISKEENVILHLFDNREGFELQEEVVLA